MKGYTLDELLDEQYGPRGTRRREKFEVSTRILGWRLGLMFKDIIDVKKTIKWKSTTT